MTNSTREELEELIGEAAVRGAAPAPVIIGGAILSVGEEIISALEGIRIALREIREVMEENR